MSARKATEIVPTMLRIREDLRKRLEREAKNNDVSMNQEITDRLERSLAQDDEYEAHMREMQEREAEVEGEYRQHLEEMAKEEARQKAALRDVLIVDMLIGEHPGSARLLRTIAFQLANNPEWSDTPESKNEFADRLRNYILNNEFRRPQ
jgi:hypothetical protein